MMNARNFDEFFKQAVGVAPFPFQERFAEALPPPRLVRIHTGLGKTAMAVVGWLWRRFGGNEKRKAATPRRLVYCLPMRVLVEQTAQNARQWVRKLKDAGILGSDVRVYILMGGEEEENWDMYPEREAILIGTQDMLLSRALNRGYGASRSRWPVQFGLLHTDCLWVFDEIQLMGAGLPTTAQLEAFRQMLPVKNAEQASRGHGCQSVWMSATMQTEWLKTVDFTPKADELSQLELNNEDHGHEQVSRRWGARKPLKKAASAMGDAAGIAAAVREVHRPGTRTIVVVNTVKRARELFEKLSNADGVGLKKGAKSKKARESEDAAAPPVPQPKLVLLHSRFRPEDRRGRVHDALAEIEPGEPGTIVVSTQVIEAGVDVSATTLFTELAPWASLVQRFGRCNRRGEDDGAQAFWIDLPDGKADTQKPYSLNDLDESRKRLKKLTDVGLACLPKVKLPFEHTHVIRRKDLIDLFDTTPDLAGNDIDIDRFVREVEDSDVRVFWRDWDRKLSQAPPENEPAPRTEELCPAPIGEFRDFFKKHRQETWQWNFLNREWERVDLSKIAPGQVFLVHAGAGGYSAARGWDPDSEHHVVPIAPPNGTKGGLPDATEDDRLSCIGVWQTITEHAGEVCAELDDIVKVLSITDPEAEAMRHAARWHDRGKAHHVFQAALPDGAPDGSNVWAKAAGAWKGYSRRHFRHELASALGVLLSPDGLIPAAQRDLVAYLVAAHHGKVRLSIRSLPNESRPDGGRRFARGVWNGDELPATDLGGGVTAPAVILSLEPMELGLCAEPPFTGQPSWAERMLHLRDALGPFRLAYLEAVLRAADRRASRAAEQRAGARRNAEAADGGNEVIHGRDDSPRS
jgi:CRISPR-associated endonuclease/helicase Cas3